MKSLHFKFALENNIYNMAIKHIFLIFALFGISCAFSGHGRTFDDFLPRILASNGDFTFPNNSIKLGDNINAHFTFTTESSKDYLTVAFECSVSSSWFGIGIGGSSMTNADMWIFEV